MVSVNLAETVGPGNAPSPHVAVECSSRVQNAGGLPILSTRMSKRTRWLRDQIGTWLDEGLIDAGQAETLRARYPVSDQDTPWSRIIVSSVGAIVFGLGIILFFAYNWADMHKVTKLALVFGAVLAAHGTGFYLSASADAKRSLGMSLKMLRFHRRNRNTNLDEVTEPLSPKLEISLQNVSEAPLMVADPGNHCGFHMETTARVARQYRAAYEGCRDIRVYGDDLIELAPGEAYTVSLDLSEPRWYVSVDGHTGEIGRYANNDSFRIVYRSPTAGLAIAGDREWKGKLPSSAFTAFQVLD